VNTSQEDSLGGSSATKRKGYVIAVMIVETMRPDLLPEPNLYFMKVDLEGVISYEDDPVIIFVVTVGRRVHRVFIDQGSSADVMFWLTFNSLQLYPDQLKPYDNFLFGFAGDQVEVRGYIELRTNFSYGTSARTVSIRYIVVNASSAYNFLLGRPSLNRLGAVTSTKHMKMKLSFLDRIVITIKSDQKTTRKCYKRSLKCRRRMYSIAAKAVEPEEIMEAGITSER